METTFGFGFVVDAVEPYNTLEENVKFWMGCGIFRNFKQWPENI